MQLRAAAFPPSCQEVLGLWMCVVGGGGGEGVLEGASVVPSMKNLKEPFGHCLRCLKWCLWTGVGSECLGSTSWVLMPPAPAL